MLKLDTTSSIKAELVEKYKNGEFRILGGGNEKQQTKTIEIQNAHFLADKDYIIREPNYNYANREIEWYKSMSLNVNDIPGGAPKMWLACATENGFINSNYGWMIWSKDNYSQYEYCLNKLIKDPHTREACMIYQRPSMQIEYNKDGMHDFCCTWSVQCFINEDKNGKKHLKYIVNMRSNDAIFGYCNDIIWHKYVQTELANDLSLYFKEEIICDTIEWNAGSLHVYERHFKYLEE